MLLLHCAMYCTEFADFIGSPVGHHTRDTGCITLKLQAQANDTASSAKQLA